MTFEGNWGELSDEQERVAFHGETDRPDECPICGSDTVPRVRSRRAVDEDGDTVVTDEPVVFVECAVCQVPAVALVDNDQTAGFYTEVER
jgi:hypothetical protein